MTQNTGFQWKQALAIIYMLKSIFSAWEKQDSEQEI